MPIPEINALLYRTNTILTGQTARAKRRSLLVYDGEVKETEAGTSGAK